MLFFNNVFKRDIIWWMDFIFPQGEFGSDGAKVNYMIDSDSIQYVLCVYSYTI